MSDSYKALTVSLEYMKRLQSFYDPELDKERDTKLRADITMVEEMLAEEGVMSLILDRSITPEQLSDVAWKAARDMLDDELGLKTKFVEASQCDQMVFWTLIMKALALECKQIIIQLDYDEDEDE